MSGFGGLAQSDGLDRSRRQARRPIVRSLAGTLLLLVAAPSFAGVNYYLSDNLHSIDPVKWTAVGAVSPSAMGLAAPDVNGEALISKLPVPDGTAEGEVLATITLLHSGGTYTEFLQASSGAHTGPQGAGAYLAFEMQNPTLDSSGHCTANFLVLQSTANGQVSLVSGFLHACRNGMTLRFAVHGKTALVWPDQALPIEFPVNAAVGAPASGLTIRRPATRSRRCSSG